MEPNKEKLGTYISGSFFFSSLLSTLLPVASVGVAQADVGSCGSCEQMYAEQRKPRVNAYDWQEPMLQAREKWKSLLQGHMQILTEYTESIGHSSLLWDVYRDFLQKPVTPPPYTLHNKHTGVQGCFTVCADVSEQAGPILFSAFLYICLFFLCSLIIPSQFSMTKSCWTRQAHVTGKEVWWMQVREKSEEWDPLSLETLHLRHWHPSIRGSNVSPRVRAYEVLPATTPLKMAPFSDIPTWT